MYIVLANLVAFLHFAFIAFFIFAVVLSVQGKLENYRVIQVVFWMWLGGKMLSFIVLNACIFTTTEQYLRSLAGVGYTEGFIVHYSSQLGLTLSDITIAYLVLTPVIVGLLSELYWQRRKGIGLYRRIKNN